MTEAKCKSVPAAWFHLYNIHKQANQSLRVEVRVVDTWWGEGRARDRDGSFQSAPYTSMCTSWSFFKLHTCLCAFLCGCYISRKYLHKKKNMFCQTENRYFIATVEKAFRLSSLLCCQKCKSTSSMCMCPYVCVCAYMCCVHTCMRVCVCVCLGKWWEGHCLLVPSGLCSFVLMLEGNQ